MTKSVSVGITSPAEPTEARLIRPAGAYNVALIKLMSPPINDSVCPSGTRRKLPLTVIGVGVSPRKPKALTGATVSTLLPGSGRRSGRHPQPQDICRADMHRTWHVQRAFSPNSTPAGLSRYKFAPGMVKRSIPSMNETSPPVTRPMMLFTEFGPLKVALSPVLMENWPKLWNRLPPTWRPRSRLSGNPVPARRRPAQRAVQSDTAVCGEGDSHRSQSDGRTDEPPVIMRKAKCVHGTYLTANCRSAETATNSLDAGSGGRPTTDLRLLQRLGLGHVGFCNCR